MPSSSKHQRGCQFASRFPMHNGCSSLSAHRYCRLTICKALETCAVLSAHRYCRLTICKALEACAVLSAHRYCRLTRLERPSGRAPEKELKARLLKDKHTEGAHSRE